MELVDPEADGMRDFFQAPFCVEDGAIKPREERSHDSVG
jgi:hypothetical protein